MDYCALFITPASRSSVVHNICLSWSVLKMTVQMYSLWTRIYCNVLFGVLWAAWQFSGQHCCPTARRSLVQFPVWTWELCKFSTYLQGLSSGPPVSSHSLKNMQTKLVFSVVFSSLIKFAQILMDLRLHIGLLLGSNQNGYSFIRLQRKMLLVSNVSLKYSGRYAFLRGFLDLNFL